MVLLLLCLLACFPGSGSDYTPLKLCSSSTATTEGFRLEEAEKEKGVMSKQLQGEDWTGGRVRGESSQQSSCISFGRSRVSECSPKCIRSIVHESQRAAVQLVKTKPWLSGSATLLSKLQRRVLWQMRAVLCIRKAWGPVFCAHGHFHQHQDQLCAVPLEQPSPHEWMCWGCNPSPGIELEDFPLWESPKQKRPTAKQTEIPPKATESCCSGCLLSFPGCVVMETCGGRLPRAVQIQITVQLAGNTLV